MTATLEEITTFRVRVGDKVRIVGGGSLASEWIGLVCTVEGPDHSAGFVWLKPDSDRPDGFGRSPFCWTIEGLEKVEPERVVMRNGFAVGDRVRYTGKAGSKYASSPLVGFTGIVVEDSLSSPDNVRVQWDQELPAVLGYSETAMRTRRLGHFPANLEPIEVRGTIKPDSPEIAELRTALGDAQRELENARQEAQRERDALQAFKDRVRDAVIEEAEVQDWCDRTDSWLEELGLEPRNYWGNLPRNMYAVVELTGNRIAVLKDGDNRPWYVTGIGSHEGQTGWKSGEDILGEYVRTLNNGDEGDTWDAHQ